MQRDAGMEPLPCPPFRLHNCIRMHYECPLLHDDFTLEECVMDGILLSKLHIATTAAAIAKLEELLQQKLKLSKDLDVPTEHSIITDMDEDCIVCLEALSSLQTCTLACGHRLHLACAIAWKEAQPKEASCPCCRASMGNPHMSTTVSFHANQSQVTVAESLDVSTEHSLQPIEWKTWSIDAIGEYPVLMSTTDTSNYQMTEVFSIRLGKADNFVRLDVSTPKMQPELMHFAVVEDGGAFLMVSQDDRVPTTAELCECLMLMQARKRINQRVANWSLTQFERNEKKDYEMVAKLLLCVLSDHK